MEYKPKMKNILFFHIVNPMLLLLILIVTFISPGLYHFSLSLILLNMIFNLITWLSVHNVVNLSKEKITVTGFKKKFSLRYDSISHIENAHIPLPSLQPYESLTLYTKGATYKIYAGFLDEGFDEIANKIRRRIENE